MSLAAEADLPLEALLARRQALVAELRDVEHWHRLATARLDLAVAAVTDIDELASRPLPAAPPAPDGLRRRVGIPACADALPETAVLLRLRTVLDELELYAAALRRSCDQVSQEVLHKLDAEGHLEVFCRQLRDQRRDHHGSRRAVTRRGRSGRTRGRPRPCPSPLVSGPGTIPRDDDRL